MPPNKLPINHTIYSTFILILFFFNLQGCVSIESTKDPNFSKEINKIYVLVNGSEDAQKFLERLCKSLKIDFSAKDIQMNYYIHDPLTLRSKSEIEQMVNSFAPDVIITIIQTEQTFHHGVESGGKFVLGMYEPASDKPVWKATVDTHTNGYAGTGPPAETADRIVEQLEKDRILPRYSSY